MTGLSNAMNSDLGKKVGNVLTAFPGRYFTGGTKELERLGKGKDGPNLNGGFFSTQGTWLDPDFIRGGIESVKNPQQLDPWSMGFSGKGTSRD